MNKKEIILWGVGTSRTIRPIWVAEELGLSYKVKPIGPRTGETQTELKKLDEPTRESHNKQTSKWR